jgi:hypothetical protein
MPNWYLNSVGWIVSFLRYAALRLLWTLCGPGRHNVIKTYRGELKALKALRRTPSPALLRRLKALKALRRTPSTALLRRLRALKALRRTPSTALLRRLKALKALRRTPSTAPVPHAAIRRSF